MRRFFARFAADTDGVTFVEGLLVFPIMVLAISVCVEFGYAMYQMNMAAKAMELGVRRVIVSPRFIQISDDDWSDYWFDNTKGGQVIDTGSANPIGKTLSCTGNACDNTWMDWLVGPNGPSNTWPGLKNYYPQIEKTNIRITYQQSGLGYEGRPSGPVLTVRMELVNQSFNLPILGKLLEIANINLPPLTVSATTEDLKDGP